MYVDLAPLKAKALDFPEPVRSLILEEPDELEFKSYLSKMETWERLLKMGVQK